MFGSRICPGSDSTAWICNHYIKCLALLPVDGWANWNSRFSKDDTHEGEKASASTEGMAFEEKSTKS